VRTQFSLKKNIKISHYTVQVIEHFGEDTVVEGVKNGFSELRLDTMIG